MRFPEIENVENKTKAILEEAGVSTIQNPAYLNFAREVYSFRRRFDGQTLLNRANVAMNKWVGRGLDQDILEMIRNMVFTLAPPGP